MLGLVLYVGSFVLALLGVALFGMPRHITASQTHTIVGVGCVGLLVMFAQIAGFVMACLGRAWGATLLIFATAMDLFTFLVVLIAAPEVILHGPSVITMPLSIVSVICFVVPSAWQYYEKSATYRGSQG